MKLQQLLTNLWEQYVTDSPSALSVYNLLTDAGEEVVNDHIAFRTFSDPRINVNQLGKFWLELDYEVKGEYRFDTKKLTAKHFEHKYDEKMPKIFISQLETSEFSPFLQEVATNCANKIPEKLLQSSEILYSGNCFGELDYNIYQKLLTESEYAAWLYVFGFRANHFTVYVNYLQKYNSVHLLNDFLKQNNFQLNTAGGEVKGTPEQLLEQSSTMAGHVDVKFKQGTYSIPNSFYEFAKRYNTKDGNLYQGFIANSADKLFESTNTY